MLIEKEWLDFGHQFSTRCGHTTLNNAEDQRSPIFLIFVDCVWQLMRQFPDSFEYNETLLLALMDNVYSCRYGTFLGNCAKERRVGQIQDRTVSIWRFVSENLHLFRNPHFREFASLILPSVLAKNLVLWSGWHSRRDCSLVPPPPPPTYYN